MRYLLHWYKAMFLDYPYWRVRYDTKRGNSFRSVPLHYKRAKKMARTLMSQERGIATIRIDYKLIGR